MVDDARTPDDSETADQAEEEVLADRLRCAAESLTIEFQISPAQAERLIFDVAREFLSEAKVAQFVPTLATRRARQLLRDGEAAGASPSGADLEVIVVDLIEEAGTDPVVVTPATAADEPVRGPATPVPPRSPADYAAEAKRLLERAKALRATALIPAGTEE